MISQWLQSEFSSGDSADKMALYHLQTGGKCLRGQIVLSQAKDYGLSQDLVRHWVVACELLHNATLIHDDIQDNDTMRRGQASLWKKYGVAHAINVGDLFIFKAFQAANRTQSPALIEILSQSAEDLVRGQSRELESHQWTPSWNDYLQVCREKTGALFELPPHGVSVIAQRPWGYRQKEIWLNLGIAYQITDDIKDYLGLKQEGQKQKDLAEKRVNGIVALMAENQENHELIADYLRSDSYSAPMLQPLRQAIDEQNIVAQLLQRAMDHYRFFFEKINPSTQAVVDEYMQHAIPKNEVPSYVPIQA
jgi:geranylgeranyl diphosphate synthase, type I